MTSGVGLYFLLRYIFLTQRIISTGRMTGRAGALTWASSHQVFSPDPVQANQKLSLGSVSSQAIALTTNFWKNKIYFWLQPRVEQEHTHTSEQLTLFLCEKAHFVLLWWEETLQFTDILGSHVAVTRGWSDVSTCMVSQSCSCARLELGNFKEFY